MKDITTSGHYDLKIDGNVNNIDESKTYSINAIVHDGDMILDGVTKVDGATLTGKVYEFGDATNDVANATRNAQNMVILKVNGNLIINEGVTLTSCKSANNYGGPKGLLIYCIGTLTNNGIISMTARGAKATGENVYLWKNTDASWEYVPAVGATGGASRTSISWRSPITGASGAVGTRRATGGGGSGGSIGDDWIASKNLTAVSGAGAASTSYSGGSGGGGTSFTTAYSGTANGGAGGAGRYGNGSGLVVGSGGGAGNPGGAGQGNSATNGTNGTGGLLIIYAIDIINNAGTISSNGSAGGNGYRTGGGGSGRRKYKYLL